MMKKLKESFMLGIVVIVPIVATIMFLKVLINVLSVPFTTFFHHNISPVVSVVISVGIVIFVGILAKNFVGKFIIDFLESFLENCTFLYNSVQNCTRFCTILEDFREKINVFLVWAKNDICCSSDFDQK